MQLILGTRQVSQVFVPAYSKRGKEKQIADSYFQLGYCLPKLHE